MNTAQKVNTLNNKVALRDLKDSIDRINPDSVQLNTLDRPGTISDLEPIAYNTLHEISDFWDQNNIEIIASGVKRREVQSYKSNVEAMIFSTISRRPCTLDDLTVITGLHRSEINKYLEVLESENKIEANLQKRGIFYQAIIDFNQY